MQNNIFNNVYNGKKILVTGHTGFKGGWLSLWLKELGAEVIGYSLDPPTKPSFFEAVDLKNKIIHIIGDVRDEKHLLSVFEKYQPELTNAQYFLSKYFGNFFSNSFVNLPAVSHISNEASIKLNKSYLSKILPDGGILSKIFPL